MLKKNLIRDTKMKLNSIESLEKMEAPFAKKLAEILYPYINVMKMTRPSVYGDSNENNRVKIAAGVVLNNTLFNIEGGGGLLSNIILFSDTMYAY